MLLLKSTLLSPWMVPSTSRLLIICSDFQIWTLLYWKLTVVTSSEPRMVTLELQIMLPPNSDSVPTVRLDENVTLL